MSQYTGQSAGARLGCTCFFHVELSARVGGSRMASCADCLAMDYSPAIDSGQTIVAVLAMTSDLDIAL